MIVILDNYDSFTYNLYQAVAVHDPDLVVLRNDQASVAEIKALQPDGIIISPGPSRPEQAGIGIELVKALAPTIPILGVCLGHQIITVAFGGEVALAPRPVHGKQVKVFHLREKLYRDLPLPFVAARYHSLIATRERVPACLIADAESPDGLVMGVHHEQYPTFGVQFHPESILTPCGDQLLANFIEICRQAKIPAVTAQEQGNHA